MKKGRNAIIVRSLAAALSVPALLGALPAQADEPADLRVNQELLQRRLDQLAQARLPGNPYGVGTPLDAARSASGAVSKRSRTRREG